jgi:hypothetical protein
MEWQWDVEVGWVGLNGKGKGLPQPSKIFFFRHNFYLRG